MFVIISVAVALALGLALYLLRRGLRTERLDPGAVSTRWLSELRRDEPWTRS